jgi:hypothetical protein
MQLSVIETNSSGCSSSPGSVSIGVVPIGSQLAFFTLQQCRVVDTRQAAGPYGAPPLAAGQVRVFGITGRCGVPAEAVAIAVNATVDSPGALGHLSLFPAGISAPLASTLNFGAAKTRASNAISLLSGGVLAVSCVMTNPLAATDFILDISGYFAFVPQ